MDQTSKELQILRTALEGSFNALRSMLEQSDRRISELTERISSLEALLAKQAPAPALVAALPELQVFVDAIDSERKPYVCRMTGIASGTFRLSPVRAAILFVLLVDLGERLEGQPGVQNRVDAMLSVFQALDTGAEEPANAAESLRVAVYRFKDFLSRERISLADGYELKFNSQSLTLELATSGQIGPLSGRFHFATNDTRVAQAVDRISLTSIIAKAIKRGALFVAPGPGGYDKLLLELFDHDYDLTAITTYFRPSSVSYPRLLLERMGTSEAILRRWDLAHAGYENGRFRYLEILNTAVLWNFIRQTDSGRFWMYPSTIKQDEVETHLEFLIEKIGSLRTYELVLSDALFPFYLGLFEVRSTPLPKSLTLFFRQIETTEPLHDTSGLLIHDAAVYQTMNTRIIETILRHPSTVRDKRAVSRALIAVLEHLRACGPLDVGEPAPKVSS